MINFESGTLEKAGYVIIDGIKYTVTMPTYSGNTPLSADNLNKLQNDLQTLIDNREHKHTYYTYEVTEDISSGTEITLPCDYIVSSNNLVLYDFFGKRLIKDTHYTEVGEEGEVSSTVILLFDVKYSEEYEKVFDIVIKEVDND